MALSLSTGDLARLESATRTLLSPLAFGDVDAWRGEVMRTFCDVLDAETGSFHLPGQTRPHLVRGLDDAARRLMDTYLGPAWGKAGAGPDPMLDLFCRIASEISLEVWDNPYADFVLGGNGESTKTPFWNDVVVPLHCVDSQSLFVATPRGAVQLTAHTLRRSPGPGQHLPILRVLLPAFKAGLDILRRFAAHRATLDAVAEPLAAFGPDGTELFRNRALSRLLGADPEGPLLATALAELARRVRPLAFALQSDPAGMTPPSANVQTAAARYTLRAALLPPEGQVFGEAFLITVAADAGAPALPTPAEVRERHGLTQREAEIALIVAQGLSNDEIAARLFVSRHTVRHHVESVMAKLALTGRGREAVAARLLGAEPVSCAAVSRVAVSRVRRRSARPRV